MACEWTSGYNRECDSVAGVNVWYGISKKNIDDYTIVDGKITAMTLIPGTYAYPFYVEAETSTFSVTSIGERTNSAFATDQSATVVLNGNTEEMIVNLENMAKDRTIWIAELNDGSYEALFLGSTKNKGTGGKVSFARTVGTVYEDLNGNTLTITGKSDINAPKIDSAVVLAMVAPVS